MPVKGSGPQEGGKGLWKFTFGLLFSKFFAAKGFKGAARFFSGRGTGGGDLASPPPPFIGLITFGKTKLTSDVDQGVQV